MSKSVLPAHQPWDEFTVGVLGLGRSGRGAVALLSRHGARAVAFDDRADLPDDVVAELAEWGVECRAASDDVRGAVSALDALVVSPGVASQRHPLVRAAEERGLPVIGELELASRRAVAPILAITGTNGKSTTVSLVHAILLAAGHDSRLVGNIGTAVSDHVEEVGADGFLVVEASSFQLERVEHFAPVAAAILNLAPDHLDRYDSFEAYGQAKRNILRAATADTLYVFPVDDPLLSGWSESTPAREGGFGWNRTERSIAWVEDDAVVRRSAGSFERLVDAVADGNATTKSKPDPEVFLVAAKLLDLPPAECLVVEDALRLDLPVDAVRRAITGFVGLEHRAVTVPTGDGRTWIDDSKATNVHAATATLEGLDGPVVALFGGRGKDEDYAPLSRFADRVRVALCFGEEGPRFERTLSPAMSCELHARMVDALARAREAAQPGDTILLSPACASFDEFTGFAQRGDVFQAWVRENVGESR